MVETASMTSVHKLLKMIVGQTCVTIYDGSVTNIAYAGPLTPLPFAESAVEGLANLDGRPIVQVDLSRALGGPAGTGAKLAVVTVPAGEIALRVQDAVFDADTAAKLPMLPKRSTFRPCCPGPPISGFGLRTGRLTRHRRPKPLRRPSTSCSPQPVARRSACW
jgi:hypothetical protein